MNNDNIFNNIPSDLPEEISETILSGRQIRIERIISKGHVSPENFWYDQDENEWVIVIKGCGELLFEEDNKSVKLEEGSYINIPAHKKHRVVWTDPGTETIWIAVFY